MEQFLHNIHKCFWHCVWKIAAYYAETAPLHFTTKSNNAQYLRTCVLFAWKKKKKSLKYYAEFDW